MKQVVQPLAGGPVEVLDVPRPVTGPTEVLVRTVASVISPGTERAVTALAQSSLLAKARARPDLVRQVARKARTEGFAATRQVVRGRLAQDLPLGYSAAGVVLETGTAVTGVRPGQLVATGGAGQANHAEFQAVPGLLCATVPDGVSAADAAFTTVAAIALHSLRLAEAGPGSKVVVLGLGLIGQLAARLAIASGCEVAGIDPAEHPRRTAASSGVLALDERGDATTDQVLSWSRGRGADAVLVCAADRSPDVVMRVPVLCRDRTAVVIVGDVGLELNRAPFYERELSLRFARSYGPGRYEPSYEAWGVDFPAGQVRWTEGRNFEAVLDLLASGRLQVADLVTHSFGIAQADAAYQLIERHTDPYLAIRLTYPEADTEEEANAGLAAGGAVRLRDAPRVNSSPGIGWAGVGPFSTGTLLPAFRAAGFDHFVAVASASGLAARRAAERHGFEKAVPGADALLDDPGVEAVVIATPHDTHAALTARALAAGRHVWCEKPVALTEDELDAVEKAWRESGTQLAIGFNRRWSPAVLTAQRELAGVTAPKLIVYRVAAGPVPDGHWYHDRRQGGRLLGEICHFVDTAQALVGEPIEDVTGLPGGGGPGVRHGDDAVVSLRFADGSLAAIAYSSAAPVAGKEWIEIQAGSRRVLIDDFRSVLADGKTAWKGRQNKGHRAEATTFRQALAGGPAMPTQAMLATMRATIQAAGPAAVTDQTMAHLEQVQRLFDEKAATWPAKYAPRGRLADRLTQLADAVGYRVAAGGRVLDLGCGSGELARHLAAAGLRVTGCDISANMLAHAAACDPAASVGLVRLAPGWRTLPFAAVTFDAVVAASVLEYVSSPPEVLQECARVLRPGGVMLCTVPDPTHPMRWLEWLAGVMAPTPAVRAAGRHWPRFGGYLTYLEISRQRRSAKWWSAAAAHVGLFTIPQAGSTERSPLRLFIFERPSGPGGRQ